MRLRRRMLDWGLVVVLAFGLILILPLLTRPGLPRNTGLELYSARAAQVAQLVREGFLYTRWAPHLNYGYGSPLFTFLAPLPHYLSGYHQALTDTDPLSSIKLITALSMLAAGLGMYCFARGRWGTLAGIASGPAYLFSAPIAFTLPYLYGELALLIALALLPWVAWSLDRLWLHADGGAFRLATLLITAFILCEPRLAIFGGVALAVVISTGRRQPGARPEAARYLAGALLVALGMSAFFWLPALAETGSVRWLPVQTDLFAGPIPLTESLGALPRFDLQMMNLPSFRGMGLSPLVVALLGLAAARFARKYMSVGDLMLFLAPGLILLLFATPAFAAFWPQPYVFQALMPYHALLVATFCLCGAGAQAPALLCLTRRRAAGTAALALIAPLTTLTALYPPEWSGRASLADVYSAVQQELQGEHIATLRTGLLLPTSAPDVPPPLPNLVETLRGGKFDRVKRKSTSGEVRLDVIDTRSLSLLYILNADQPFDAEFYVLNYPGWSASIGPRELLTHATPEGFVSVSLPAANGEVALRFDSSGAGDLAVFITLSSFLILLFGVRRRAAEPENQSATPVSRAELAGLALALLVFLGISALVRVVPESIALRSAPGQVAEAITPQPRFFQSGIDLIGYLLPDSAPRLGSELSLTVYWQAARPILENHQSEAWLVDPITKQRLVRVQHRHPGGIPAPRWTLGQYVRDTFSIPIPASLPPGKYLLQIAIGPCSARGLRPCEQIDGMDAYTALGQIERGLVTIPQVIEVTP